LRKAATVGGRSWDLRQKRFCAVRSQGGSLIA
jgi:hypothetical protein